METRIDVLQWMKRADGGRWEMVIISKIILPK